VALKSGLALRGSLWVFALLAESSAFLVLSPFSRRRRNECCLEFDLIYFLDQLNPDFYKLLLVTGCGCGCVLSTDGISLNHMLQFSDISNAS
jgi:hypothetical protein